MSEETPVSNAHDVLQQSITPTQTNSPLTRSGQSRDAREKLLLPHIPLLYRDEILSRLLIDLFLSKKGATPCGK